MNKFLAMGIALRKYCAISLLLTLVFQTNLSAQTCSPSYNNPWQWGPHSTWFFGEGVFLNFPGGVGAPVLSYKPVMGDDNRGYEGTAAINDNAGTLLAYSNGRSLWQANASLIANNLLAGNEGGSVGQRSSAVQGIVAVRHPMNPSKIYIFTSDDALTNANVGVNYTILDLNTMTSSAPVRLKDDLGNDYRSTEQVEATFHANGLDVWLVVRQSGNGTSANFQNFYAYSLTCSGLNSVPVKSVAGPPVKGSWTQNWERGALKFSWDGARAVAVNHVNDWASYDEAITVYDFNNASGVLSNGKAVSGNWSGWSWSGATYEAMYDCEWAPDSKGIYIVPAGGTARLLWMDASLATANAIYSSIKVVTNTVAVPGDLKLGGDGRLYQATFNSTLNTYSFPTTADMNAGNNISVGTLALAQNSNLGLSNMFVPPIDYLDIQNPIAMDCNDAPVNLAVNWFCRGTNAEDPVGNPNGWSSNCGACITDAANGIFNPVIAGQGTHEVYYSYGALCSIADTLIITVGPCGGCLDTTLAPSIPAVCSTNGTIDLTLYQGTAAAGTWSIVSGGGTSNISGGNTFNINNTPAGNYVVQYTVTGQGGGCGNNPQRTIRVNRPNVTLTLADDAACINEAAFNLSGGSPGGGTYSGTGVGVSPSFNPGTAGVGPHTITYTYTDGNSCSATATDILTVNDTTPVTFVLPDDEICINEGNLTLTGGLPGGGTYSGTGVTVSPTFDPITAGLGNKTITYTFTNGNGCVNSNTDVITVNDTSVVTLVLDDNAACINESAFNLNGGSPGGGTYSGTGVGVSPSFNPGTAGVGPHTITYTFTNPSGCTTDATDVITVNALPVVTLSLVDDAACIDEAAFALSGGSPNGGTYSGSGITVSPSFDPANAGGAGKKQITYTYTDGNSCTNTATDSITVNALPVVTLTLAQDSACVNGGTVALAGGSPNGGTYSGIGVNSGNFDPSVNGVGDVTITYTYTDANTCTNSATDILTVTDTAIVTVVFVDDAACIDEAAFALSGGSPNGGTYSGAGITTSPTFNPATAGAGDHIITYTYTNAAGCTTSSTDTMTVNPLPVVTLTLGDNAACIDEAAFALTGGSPNGGTYSGAGITTSPTFDPTNAGGAGSKTITYTYTDGNGCVNSATANLTVNNLPTVSMADAEVCPGGNIVLAPSPNVWAAHSWSTGSTNDTIHYNIPNTTVWVDVTDVNGCVSRATANIGMGDTLHVDFGADQDICANQSTTLNAAQYGPFQAPVTYDWDDLSSGVEPSSRIVSQQKLYGVRVMDGRGCVGSDSINITVHNLPQVSLGPDTLICFTGKEFLTKYIPDTFSTVLWSTGATDTLTSVYAVGTLGVLVTNQFACAAGDTMNVGEFCEPTIICVPNVVTPNGDGQNDIFKPCHDVMKEITDGEYKSIMDNILKINFQVYDRWGLKMYQSTNVFPQWDMQYNGKKVADGVYYWIITYTDSSHKKYELTGWVQVID
jgi:gliding motility-associated-like protein